MRAQTAAAAAAATGAAGRQPTLRTCAAPPCTPIPARWLQLAEFMAGLGYAGVAQARAASHGSDFMLALFFRTVRLRPGCGCWRCAGRAPACAPAARRTPCGPLALPAASAGAALLKRPPTPPPPPPLQQDKFELVWEEERSRALLAALRCKADGPARGQVVWLANVHLEGSPYRPNDRISQLKHALQRLEGHIGGPLGARGRPAGVRGACGALLELCAAPMGQHAPLCSASPRHPATPALPAAAEAADVVILGDFNSVEHDSPCWLLRRGRLERNHTDACCPQVPARWGCCAGLGQAQLHCHTCGSRGLPKPYALAPLIMCVCTPPRPPAGPRRCPPLRRRSRTRLRCTRRTRRRASASPLRARHAWAVDAGAAAAAAVGVFEACVCPLLTAASPSHPPSSKTHPPCRWGVRTRYWTSSGAPATCLWSP